MIQVIIPIIAAISGSIQNFLSKYILSKDKVGYKLFTEAAFVIISALMLIVSPFFFVFNKDFFLINNVIVFLIVVAIGIIANIMLSKGLKSEKLVEADAMLVFGSLFTILFSVLMYADERDPVIIFPAIIASAALIWSHIKKHHLVFHKAALLVLGAHLIFAFENNLIKYLLRTYEPFTLYFLRCLFMAVILTLYFRPDFSKLGRKQDIHLVIAQIFVITELVLRMYSYKHYGVVYTSLILTLMPILLYVYALVFLKEKLEIKKLAAGVVILACVVMAQVM